MIPPLSISKDSFFRKRRVACVRSWDKTITCFVLLSDMKRLLDSFKRLGVANQEQVSAYDDEKQPPIHGLIRPRCISIYYGSVFV